MRAIRDGGTPHEEGGLAGAVGRVTSILAIPYGYTVTLGSAALLSVSRLGTPGELDVLLFAVGAVLGFILLAAIGYPHLAVEIPMRVPWVIVFNFFPVLAALVVIAAPTSLSGRTWGYCATSFLATVVYVGSLATLVRVVGRRKIPFPLDTGPTHRV